MFFSFRGCTHSARQHVTLLHKWSYNSKFKLNDNPKNSHNDSHYAQKSLCLNLRRSFHQLGVNRLAQKNINKTLRGISSSSTYSPPSSSSIRSKYWSNAGAGGSPIITPLIFNYHAAHDWNFKIYSVWLGLNIYIVK